MTNQVAQLARMYPGTAVDQQCRDSVDPLVYWPARDALYWRTIEPVWEFVGARVADHLSPVGSSDGFL